MSEKVSRLDFIAWDCHYIAEAFLKQNRVNDEALSLSCRAVEIFTRLRHPDLQSAQETLEEIENSLGDVGAWQCHAPTSPNKYDTTQT